MDSRAQASPLVTALEEGWRAIQNLLFLLWGQCSFSHSVLSFWLEAGIRLLVTLLSQEEKRRLREEIEKRRAEAAEKRQKLPEDSLSDDKKPFKCFTPKGSSLKVLFPPRKTSHHTSVVM